MTQRVRVFDTDGLNDALTDAAGHLADGRGVILPTETVYGVAARLDVAGGRELLKRLRKNPASPLTPHLPDAAAAEAVTGDLPPLARRAMRKLWPGPVSIVVDVPAERRREVAATLGLEEGDLYAKAGTVTLRCPDNLLFVEVARSAGVPVGVAHPPGGPFYDVPDDEVTDVPLAFDAGPTRFRKPSTTIRIPAGAKDVGDYELVRQGVYDKRMIDRALMTNLLFVCSGNTCRSPMAEALARKLLARKLDVAQTELEAKGYTVSSAGTFAMPGGRATPAAEDAVAAMGGDLSRHRSQPLSVELVHRADWVLTMGRSHAEQVVSLVPAAEGKVLTLDPAGDIDDPIGGSDELYRSLAATLEELIGRRLDETVMARAG